MTWPALIITKCITRKCRIIRNRIIDQKPKHRFNWCELICNTWWTGHHCRLEILINRTSHKSNYWSIAKHSMFISFMKQELVSYFCNCMFVRDMMKDLILSATPTQTEWLFVYCHCLFFNLVIKDTIKEHQKTQGYCL